MRLNQFHELSLSYRLLASDDKNLTEENSASQEK